MLQSMYATIVGLRNAGMSKTRIRERTGLSRETLALTLDSAILPTVCRNHWFAGRITNADVRRLIDAKSVGSTFFREEWLWLRFYGSSANDRPSVQAIVERAENSQPDVAKALYWSIGWNV